MRLRKIFFVCLVVLGLLCFLMLLPREVKWKSNIIESKIKKEECSFCKSDIWERYKDNNGIGLYNVSANELHDLGLEENLKKISQGTNIITANNKDANITKEIIRERNICIISVESKKQIDTNKGAHSYCQECLTEIYYNRNYNYILVFFGERTMIPMNGYKGISFRGDFSIIYDWVGLKFEAEVIYTPII